MNEPNCLDLLQDLLVDGCYPGIFSDRVVESGRGDTLAVNSPINGELLGSFNCISDHQLTGTVDLAKEAFLQWRRVPAPARGELVRNCGLAFRRHKQQLAELISWETGKILQEALGEVQEVIDICDFAVGLSRQLYGLTIASERPQHRLTEQWHPLGPVGIITAFNFPMAVWAWNAMIALVCGNSLVWKPSEKTPLCALACQQILNAAIDACDDAPGHLSSVIVGKSQSGQQLAADKRIALISATGSVRMGRAVAQIVASRLGRCLLELGGNNAAIITPAADLALAVRSCTFAAVGTCGQRCTSLRRLIIHEDLIDEVADLLVQAYRRLRIGNPLESTTLVGPLIDHQAFKSMQISMKAARSQGGALLHGGERIIPLGLENGWYVAPALIRIDKKATILQTETFAPVLYLTPYEQLDEAISIQNSVPQGLSSAIFTNDLREAEIFTSAVGSDCGIANVNIATSGAEIGGAFGGEKDTGGGRESGSDAWKNYMRRSTNTINYGSRLPLAQGIQFEL